MMMKLLEKALKDAIKENNCVIGTKKILSSTINIKMVVISQSVTTENIKKIKENVQNEKIFCCVGKTLWFAISCINFLAKIIK
jgi:ribosomal protein L30E